jgi:hypothetical protein
VIPSEFNSRTIAVNLGAAMNQLGLRQFRERLFNHCQIRNG